MDLETMQIKVVDFGFAKFFGRFEDYSPTIRGKMSTDQTQGMSVPLGGDAILNTPKGSLKYLAPEIIKHIITHRSTPSVTTRPEIQKVDLYAAGVVVYVMLCGRFPFRGTDKDTILHHITKGVNFRDENWNGVSEDGKEFVAWLLNPDAHVRPVARQALKHQWLAGRGPETPLPPMADVGDGINCGVEAVRRVDSEIDNDGYIPDANLVEQVMGGFDASKYPDANQIPDRPPIKGMLNFKKK
eukprot:NODE_5458_length_944_cov_164.658952_g5239_i0.p1 GENE.NODE_5458_length_944_cov_164.658952_g5239_i0~~NODE_5458_length_944_cov_164.658952_g5239_i0.p1  ORF type:complete len:279 (+),score=75.10 NODE_5458_length_944_cov_164.658952_g5239_i0:114-839(+)